MTSLLAMEVHMSLLTWWLTQQVTSLTEDFQLDMASSAFDDQYEGCVDEMEAEAPKLLKEELNMNTLLKSEWEMAEKKWKQIKNRINYPKSFNDFHGTAVVAYTGCLAIHFNKAVREFHQNSHTFQYKAFHYYLTRALQLLRTQSCPTVYRGSKTKFSYSRTGRVRFGQFTSSSLNRNVAVSSQFFSYDGTLFVIKTCLGVNIREFSLYPLEEEVLIPGYEVYHKVTVTETSKKYNEIFLEDPQRMKSNFNCFYSSSAKNPNEQDSNFNSSGECGCHLEVGLVWPSKNRTGNASYPKPYAQPGMTRV
uniref:NAD(P)(+)--arginine ADP-ribosyltransferase n=1 Tax=Castor canadensis TaxID=51338 RepID=A0A8C0WXW9_CASCN